MTYKELYLKEHPECNIDKVMHAYCPKIKSCPFKGRKTDEQCIECWNREAPEEKSDTQKEFNRLRFLQQSYLDGTEIVDPGKNTNPKKRERDKKMVDSIDKAVNGTVSKDMDTVAEAAVKASENLAKLTSSIKDSGTRREFSTGAVRDIQEGKGRCDLMPLDVIAEHMEDSILLFIYQFTTNGNVGHLYRVLDECPAKLEMVVRPTVYLEVAKHFEAGAVKYGEWNWQKGIPTHCYIDSAVRHYLKFLRGDKDESHDRAFVWNILCCIWTCKHKPELNDYPRKEKSDE